MTRVIRVIGLLESFRLLGALGFVRSLGLLGIRFIRFTRVNTDEYR